ncbi:ribosome biogenesis ATPase RIX7 [Metarhizium album ARSEF 1941]|uniref:Peroxisomal ATPase PEX1 n=1 Tax=Metarhizium album (strain ARSEF 1941) TaxID=1081103 RepID=A0A0B2WYW6_METAS|nr:ribosome biogenesis ATPase RIX7 [Metarhizium album ARSEF 1941]KHN99233.1 ribosome biogenesis ATPase RIX7 [Metarhizium album ARSEF 1941]
MPPGMVKPRVNLRSRIERDVYTVLKHLETANGSSPFKTVTAAYDAIQRSNSSLRRQKKRILEDAIDRVLLFRKQEVDDVSDSDAAIEEAEPEKPEDERFLLNRQMTKLWHRDLPVNKSDSAEPSPAKKRRTQVDTEDTPGQMSVVETIVNGNVSEGLSTAPKQEKQQTRKTQRASRFTVEHVDEEVPLGGLAEVYGDLLEHGCRLLRFANYYEENGWERTTGILLSGPCGMGKRSLVKNLASMLGVPLVSLNGCLEDAERMEKSMAEAFDAAIAQAPSIVFVGEVDQYMSKTGSHNHNEHHSKAVRLFTQQMQRLKHRRGEDGYVLAMATTSRIADVDQGILRTGLFEVIKGLKIPDYEARQNILQTVTQKKTLAEDVDLDEIARVTHGFVAAELVLITKLATDLAAKCISEDAEDTDVRMSEMKSAIVSGDRDFFSTMRPRVRPQAPVSMADFKSVIKDFVPSLRREGFTVIPNVTWDQVGALDKARKQLHMSIIGPIKRPQVYKEFGLTQTAGILLWGPPGCGKTLVAQAIANEAKASFILINGPELLNKYVGESERAVRELFQRARSSTPCILFFDEMDSIVPPRANSSTDSGARVVNALLTELDGAQDRTGVYVIGTTNRPEMIDEAVLRPGRLGVQLFIDLPTPLERVDILRAIYRTRHENPSPVAMECLSSVAQDPRCTNFSGADLSGLHAKAAESALERWMQDETSSKEMTEADWEFALMNTRPSVRDPASYRERDMVI